MSETPGRRRGNSMANVKRRGSTYTYYVYVTDADGRRRQHSKGGFRTQRAAEDARIEALSALAKGTYVKAERISLADYLTDEWLPFRRPPVLEDSTWHSYDRYLRLHVIPHIGAVPLQKLTPVDLNRLYRHLLANGRRPVSGPGGRRPVVRARAVELRATGLTYEQIAVQLRDEFEDESSDHQERRRSALAPRGHAGETARPVSGPGAAHRALHPHDSPRRAQRRASMEPGRAQRRRRRHSPIGGRRSLKASQSVDSGAAASVPRLRRRQPVPAGMDLPRHEWLPTRRVPRPPLARCRPRRGDGCHLPPSDRARPPGDREGAPEDEAGTSHPPRRGHRRPSQARTAPTGRVEAPPRARVPRRGLRVLPVRRPTPPPRAVLPGVRPEAGRLQPGSRRTARTP